MNDETILVIERLNKLASSQNELWVQPNSTEGLKVCRHKVRIRMPGLTEVDDAFLVAAGYLQTFMDVAKYNGKLVGKPVYREIAVFYSPDGDCNNWVDGVPLEIGLQEFYK